MSDDELLGQFENQTLPYESWTHDAHVRVAFMYASRHSLQRATDLIRSGIQSYNNAKGVREAIDHGYHETITQAFMKLVYVANRLSGPHESYAAFSKAHPELLQKGILKAHYSKTRLMSADAKGRFVTPDCAPLPQIVDDNVTIVQATDERSVAIVRTLFVEFAESLNFDLCFQGFDSELAKLPGSYSAPQGRLLLAYHGKEPAGCVALRPLETGVSEMKRLWVRSQFRGTGMGRVLVEYLAGEAQNIGYLAMRLDTVPSMQSAIHLYRSFGFKEIKPYTINPIECALFMELKLR